MMVLHYTLERYVAGKESTRDKRRIIERRSGLNRLIIEIDADAIQVTDKGLLSVDKWSASISDFDAVCLRATLESYGEDLWRPEYTVELRRKEGKTSKLWGSHKLDDVLMFRDGLVRDLDLPGVEDTPVGVITRQPEDIFKPIRALAEGGKIDADFSTGLDAPSLAAARRTGDGWRLALRASWPFTVLFLAVGLMCIGFGALMLIFGLPQDGVIVIGYVVVILPLGLVCLNFALVPAQRFVVTPSDISYRFSILGVGVRDRYIPFSGLHTVLVTEPSGFFSFYQHAVTISGASEIVVLSLSEKQANWLGRFVMAAAAGKLPGQ